MANSIVQTFSIYGLGVDLGRYLQRLFGDNLPPEGLANKATKFVETFNTTFDHTDSKQLAEFMLGVGYGYGMEE